MHIPNLGFMTDKHLGGSNHDDGEWTYELTLTVGSTVYSTRKCGAIGNGGNPNIKNK